MLNEIFWPKRFLPGTTNNFASNEVIVEGLTEELPGNRLNGLIKAAKEKIAFKDSF